MADFISFIITSAASGILKLIANVIPSTFMTQYFIAHPSKFNQFVSLFSMVNYFLPLSEITSFIIIFGVFVASYTLFRLLYVFICKVILKK